MKTENLLSVVLIGLATACAPAGNSPIPGPGVAADPAALDQVARFTADGELRRPERWEEWVLVGASLGLSYNEPQSPSTPLASQRFRHVYLQPWAYRHVREHGEFPEGAMFILASHPASERVNPARAGLTEGASLPGFEVHLKQAGADPTGWAFYNFRSEDAASSPKVPGDQRCYTCHAAEAEFDHAFVQFYPVLRPWVVSEGESSSDRNR